MRVLGVRRLTWLTASMAAAIGLAACGSSGHVSTVSSTGAAQASTGNAQASTGKTQSTPTVSIITTGYSVQTVKSVLNQIASQAKSLGWDVQIHDSAGDFNKAIGFYQDAVAKHVTAIINGFVSTSLIEPGLKAAASAKIPVYGLDSSTSATPLEALSVTSDDAALGTQTATALVQAMGGKGTVLVVTYSPLPAIKDATSAAVSVFNRAGVHVKQTLQINSPVTAAQEVQNFVTDALTANVAPGSINGIWTPGDTFAGIPAAQTITRLHRTGVVVSTIDTNPGTVDAIHSGSPLQITTQEDYNSWVTLVINSIKAQIATGATPATSYVATPGHLITRTSA